MEHPFLDTSKLTDDQLLDRLDRAYQYLHAQTQLGHTPTVESIKAVIEALSEERATRIQKFAHTELAKKINNTDTIELGKLE